MHSDAGNNDLDLAALLDDGLRELIELVGKNGVAELRIRKGDTKLYLRSATPQVQHQPALHIAPDAHQPSPAAETKPGVPITSPIVGTFYSSSSPGEPPFVQEGDHVEVGQTVGIVEAMKIMNEIDSDVSGRVIEILVENGQAVEYGQPLMLLEVAPEQP